MRREVVESGLYGGGAAPAVDDVRVSRRTQLHQTVRLVRFEVALPARAAAAMLAAAAVPRGVHAEGEHVDALAAEWALLSTQYSTQQAHRTEHKPRLETGHGVV